MLQIWCISKFSSSDIHGAQNLRSVLRLFSLGKLTNHFWKVKSNPEERRTMYVKIKIKLMCTFSYVNFKCIFVRISTVNQIIYIFVCTFAFYLWLWPYLCVTLPFYKSSVGIMRLFGCVSFFVYLSAIFSLIFYLCLGDIFCECYDYNFIWRIIGFISVILCFVLVSFSGFREIFILHNQGVMWPKFHFSYFSGTWFPTIEE